MLSDAPPTRSPKTPPTLVLDHLELRPAEYQVLVHGRRAELTVREFEIFYVLALQRDRVVLREELYDLVWGGPMAYRDRSVDVFVRKVRRKLAAVSPEWIYVHTHFGVGYRMSIEPAPPVDPAAPARS
ncbi:MAG TPA: winged helix-turn-helix domain-containing protein [Baekduia sp.]|nr:winged helix-turn-helix domain-containing protein [Baekduia sp.]